MVFYMFIYLFGKVPKKDEAIEYSVVILKIEQLINNKIRKVRVKKV